MSVLGIEPRTFRGSIIPYVKRTHYHYAIRTLAKADLLLIFIVLYSGDGGGGRVPQIHIAIAHAVALQQIDCSLGCSIRRRNCGGTSLATEVGEAERYQQVKSGSISFWTGLQTGESIIKPPEGLETKLSSQHRMLSTMNGLWTRTIEPPRYSSTWTLEAGDSCHISRHVCTCKFDVTSGFFFLASCDDQMVPALSQGHYSHWRPAGVIGYCMVMVSLL